MIKHFKIQIVLVLILQMMLTLRLNAQEQLMPLSANSQQISTPETKQIARTTTTVAVLDLPFFDDFSYSTKSPKPDVNKWLDSGGVYVNHTFPIAPISIGVATFDGLNKKGYPYNLTALVSNSAPADKMISRPVNLKKKGSFIYQPSDSVYLSFYYQAEGRGDAPEANDSLCVDFYQPDLNKWVKVWGRKGYNPSGSDTSFHAATIVINNTLYFDSLFQFRFRNNATLSGSLDHWHVDYVYIDKGRNHLDTLRDDVTFAYMSTPFLKNYSTMPYRQYIASEMATGIGNYMRNNFNVQRYVDYNYTIKDRNLATVYTYTAGPANIDSYVPFGLNTTPTHATPTVTYIIPSPLTDTAYYTIKHIFSSTTGSITPDVCPENDTLIQIQKFSTYYAYDDGTAEGGYYNNTTGAKNAVRYTVNVADTLRAIRVYFDPITNGQNIINSSFRLMVWTDAGNGPGNVVYRDSITKRPMYLQGNYNLMPTYALEHCILLAPATYYFGIQQVSNMPLNVGFDKNNDHSSALFYDIGSGWVQSSIKGSLMINPVLGCTVPVGIEQITKSYSNVNLYPNPAQNSITLETYGLNTENATITVSSSIGQVVLNTTFVPEQTIDISNLPNGIYFVHLNSSTLNVTPKKLIISR